MAKEVYELTKLECTLKDYHAIKPFCGENYGGEIFSTVIKTFDNFETGMEELKKYRPTCVSYGYGKSRRFAVKEYVLNTMAVDDNGDFLEEVGGDFGYDFFWKNRDDDGQLIVGEWGENLHDGWGCPLMKRFEVLETDGGGVALAYFDREGDCVYFHSGYEFRKGLLDDINLIASGHNPISDCWDGNCDSDEWTTLQELYDDWEASCKVIADDDGVYIDAMGTGGREALEITSALYGFLGRFTTTKNKKRG